jgi:hypothetical protein
VRRLWQWLRCGWRRDADRRDEFAIEMALLEHELAARRGAIPEDPLPPIQGNSFGPL